MDREDALEIQQEQFGVVRLVVSLFLEDDDLEIELEVLLLVGLFKIADDLVRGDEIKIHPTEETHANLRPSLQYPNQFLIHFLLLLNLSQQLNRLLTRPIDHRIVLTMLRHKPPTVIGLLRFVERRKQSRLESGVLD